MLLKTIDKLLQDKKISKRELVEKMMDSGCLDSDESFDYCVRTALHEIGAFFTEKDRIAQKIVKSGYKLGYIRKNGDKYKVQIKKDDNIGKVDAILRDNGDVELIAEGFVIDVCR